MKEVTILKYEKQDFTTGKVEVHTNNGVVVCDMFQDKDGDLGFLLNGDEFYFRYCQKTC